MPPALCAPGACLGRAVGFQQKPHRNHKPHNPEKEKHAMCASHPIPAKAVAALPADTPPPDLAPIETAVDADAADAETLAAQKRHAERCAETVRKSPVGKFLCYVFGSAVKDAGTPFLTADTNFKPLPEDAFAEALRISKAVGPLCAPCMLTDCRAVRVREYGWVGRFTFDLEA